MIQRAAEAGITRRNESEESIVDTVEKKEEQCGLREKII